MDVPTLLRFIGAFDLTKGVGAGQSAQDLASYFKNSSTSNGTSIKYRAKELLAQYPVLVSDNLSFKSVQLITRALEHEYVNLLKLLMQNEGDSDFTNTGAFLKSFHSNIHNDVNLDPVLKSESTMEKALTEANRDLLASVREDLNMRSLNEETVTRDYKRLFNEADLPAPKDDDKDEEQVVNSAEAKIDNVDIKKANDLTPTMVKVEVNYVPKGAEVAVSKTITFGVKCVAHILNSEDIEYYLPNSVITRTPIMRMIQWTTGEIKFFKDLLFSVDEIKKTAVKGNDRSTFWWRRLQELGRVSSKFIPMLDPKGKNKKLERPIPISTMVISKENVDNIKNRHGIDILQKPSFATKIMKNFFLMTFVIIDESIETVYIYNEETKNYSAYSFSSLENINKQKNIDIKDIYQLLK